MSFLAARKTDYNTNQTYNDNSFRGRKENVNVQPHGKMTGAPGEANLKKRPQDGKGIILHKHNSSFLLKPTQRQSVSITQRGGEPVKLKETKTIQEIRTGSGLCPASMIDVMDKTTDMERQNSNSMKEYGRDIEDYLKELERKTVSEDCLSRHEITPSLRAKMVDWMVEVMTNFKCKDQTFFMGVNLMDRYLKNKEEKKLVSELHIIGVTAMFVASKYEDILPLRMQTVHEKIAHGKLSPESICGYEQDMLKTLNFFLQTPTAYEFLKRYSKSIMSGQPDKELIEKMALYLAKMSLHDYSFCGIKPSKIAISSIYVAFKISEQLRKCQILNQNTIDLMTHASGYSEESIVECAQKILTNAQNFDVLYPGLSNLKKTHFTTLMDYLPK